MQQLRLIVKMVRKASVFCSKSLAIARIAKIARIDKKNNAAGRPSPADREQRLVMLRIARLAIYVGSSNFTNYHHRAMADIHAASTLALNLKPIPDLRFSLT